MASLLTTASRFAIVAAVLTLAACSSEPSPPPQTANDVAPPPPSTASNRDSYEQPATVAVSEDIRKACGLTTSEARFAYNSAKLRDSESGVIQKLAACFATGPLRGKTMSLIGRADPRGESEYNLALGGRRASSVERALLSHSLPQSQVVTTSRGALDATGTDESGWAWDRRVDVTLAN